MTTRKRNEYLDAASSDEEEKSGYDSGAAEEATFSRTARVTLHPSKRQKTLNQSTATDDVNGFSDSPSDSEPLQREDTNPLPSTAKAVSAQCSPRGSTPSSISPAIQAGPSNPLTRTSIAASNAAARKTGVLYLSRIPPFMRPSTVRSLLGTHGPITRLFLTPEPPSSYLSRRARGGNRKKSYVDGWVEFARKRDAKICAEAINARTIGGGKGRGGRFYGDDVWNARYLRGFKWADLMADVRAEEREREERIRVGVGREGRERREFLRRVERGKAEEGRRKKREEKAEKKMKEKHDVMAVVDRTTDNPPLQNISANDTIPSSNHPLSQSSPPPPPSSSSKNPAATRRSEMRFRQTERVGGQRKEQSEDVKRVLKAIF